MASPHSHRWNRIFRDDGRAVIFAMDHAALFGARQGPNEPIEAIAAARAGGADAILTTFGVAARCADAIGALGLILRMDGGVSALAPGEERGPMSLLYDAEAALRLGADAVAAMGWPGSRFESQTLPYLGRLVGQAAAWNLPVMAEMLPGGFQNPREWWTPENVGDACRIGAEMGADFVKTAYTGDPESFRRTCRQAGVPVIVLGGSLSPDPAALFASLHGAMQAGAAGVAVGRNIYQHPHPYRMASAISAIVHENATVEQALRILN